jgi:hypothetical protein
MGRPRAADRTPVILEAAKDLLGKVIFRATIDKMCGKDGEMLPGFPPLCCFGRSYSEKSSSPTSPSGPCSI